MTQAELLAAVLQAPPDRTQSIINAALGKDRPRPGTIRQAAEILGSSTRTVERYARRGLLRTIRLSPRRIRFDLNEVEKLSIEGVTK